MKEKKIILLPVDLTLARECIDIKKLQFYLPIIKETTEYRKNERKCFEQIATLKDYKYKYIIEEVEAKEIATKIIRKYTTNIDDIINVNFDLSLTPKNENETELTISYEINLLKNTLINQGLIKAGRRLIKKKYLILLEKNLILFSNNL